MPKTKLPALKNIPPKTDRELKIALDSMKEAVEVRLGRRGDPLDRAVTLRELIESGLATSLRNSPFNPDGTGPGIGPPKQPPGDLTVPPAPTGLEASGAFTNIVLLWNQASYGNHSYTEIWRSQDNALGGATRIATTNAQVYSDEVGYGGTYYYWVRFVSITNVIGPYNDTEGTVAETEINISAVMTTLSDELKSLPGFNTLLSDINVTIDATTLSLQSTLEGIDNAVGAAATSVSSLSTNTPRVIRATTAPTTRADGSSLQSGDIFMDSDNGNEIFVYVSGTGWASSTAGATSTSDTSLQTQITANGNTISQTASDLLLVAGVTDRVNISQTINVVTLNAAITNSTTGLAANANAISVLGGRVTQTESSITAQAQDITDLESTLSGYSGTSTVATAVSDLSTRVTSTEGSITTQSQDITDLENTLSGYSGSSTVASAVSGLLTQIQSNDTDIAGANAAINTKASAASVTALNLSLTNLSNTVDGKTKTFAQTSVPTATAIGDLWINTSSGNNQLYRAAAVGADEIASGEWVLVRDAGFAANASAISTLTGTVTQQGNTISSNSGNITSLQNALSGYTGNGAVSTALNTLTNSVALKPITFFQSSIPTSSAIGDIWMDSGNDNKVYRAESVGADQKTSGEWVLVRDAGISANAQAILALQSTVNNATTGVAATSSALSTLETNVNLIPTNFYQSSQPNSGLTNGDIWVDSDDNQMYRYDGTNWASIRDATISANAQAITALESAVTGYNGTTTIASAISGLSTSVSQNASAITVNADAITAVESTVNHGTTGVAATASALSNLQTSVEAIPAQFYQATAPATSASTLGDYWIDSDDDQLYRFNGSAWESSRDSLISSTASDLNQLTTTVDDNTADISTNATAIANEVTARATAVSQVSAATAAKNQTFVGTSAPTAIAAGDLWIDTSQNNRLNRATAPGASNWIEVRDDLYGTKATIFAQSSAPTATAVGDIWIETDNDDKVYRWSGSAWEPVGIPTQASVTQLSTAVTDIEGNAAASYVLQVNANGAVAGMVIEANATDSGTTSTAVQFVADKFAIWDGSGAAASNSIAPFIVTAATTINGESVPAGVYMTNAFIKNGSIESAKIGTLSADKITFGSMHGDRITAGTINANRINGGVIQSTDLSNNTSTVIHGGNITTGTIDAQFLDADLIVSTDLGSGGSTVIDGSRITTGLINADRINVTDLVLPTVNKKVSGTVIGGFANNQMRLAQVGEIGTEPGIYQGYVRVFGGNGQVKTLSIAAGDGTYGSSGTDLLSGGNAYSNHPNSGTLPMADTGGLQYHSNRAEAWAGIARFQTTNAIAQISVTFIKRSANSVPTNLYVHAQGDNGTRQLSSVEYSFQRLALNQPDQFTFTDLVNQAVSTTFTSNTITLSGSGFTGGTATITGTGATFSINGGSYTTGSVTVSNGDTITVRVLSASTNSTPRSGEVNVAGTSESYSVTTVAGSGSGGSGGGSGGSGGGLNP
jgi:hypothetical protein